LLGLVLVLLPVLAVVVLRTGHRYVPIGDEALIDLRVRDVFTSNTPLVGAYSRGFNHPGPLLYWLLAPLSVVAGGAAWATLVGAALLQGAAIAASGWVAYRRGGLLLALGVLAALGFAYSSFTRDVQLLQPWNPYVAFPFFMLYLLQVWSIALGVRWQVLGAAVVGTLLVQLHVGYLPVVVVPALWALVVVLVDRRRRISVADSEAAAQPRWRVVLASTGGALVALWAVPVCQQLTRNPGNLSELWDYFRDAGHSIGLGAGAGIYAAEFHLLPPWLGGSNRLELFTDRVEPASVWWLLLAIAVFVVGLAAARRSGRRADQRMVELAGVTAVTSIAAIARVSVVPQEFLFPWRVISAVFVVLAMVWAVANLAQLERRSVARPAVVVLLLVVIVGFSVVRARDDVWRHRQVLGPRDGYATRLFDTVRADAPRDRPLLVRGMGSTTDGFAQGLIDDLDRDGVDVRVDPSVGYLYGEGRAAAPADVGTVWYVTQNGSNRDVLERYPQSRLLASLTPLRPASERELRSLQASMIDQLEAAGRPALRRYLDSSLFAAIVKDVDGIDDTAARRIAELNRRVEASGGCRCLVIGFPSDDVPDLPSSSAF
jgi:hypothetical protein